MKPNYKLTLLSIALACGLPAQNWEVGAGGGYGFPQSVNVAAGSAGGSAGFGTGFVASALLGNRVNRFVSGEARYTYQAGDLQVTSGGVKAAASGETHAMHYDVLVHPRWKEARVLPFLAAGGGVKIYRGTGAEPAYQPLGGLVVLSHAQEAQPLISVGGGLKVSVSRRLLLRFDFRDYATPVPTSLLATPPGSHVGGWVHDLVALAGISTVF
jgi:hypothetical protein